jgi:hypothetical protein
MLIEGDLTYAGISSLWCNWRFSKPAGSEA